MRRAILSIAVGAVLSGCGVAEVCETVMVNCPKGGTIKSCCTSLSCQYKTSDGTAIPCDGTNCTSGSPSAAKKGADWCLAH